ncbi:DUF4129 domain-containing protein [Zunongwangia profunda]|jgi:hypothetical protein|uniref:DUF4129 domain-containing protein n=1 Tax=Zunongwangia profunda TaxID=398743 RepID=UPI001D18700C|nr:DUF4129 domain-containing protein [Zunongwangia profunda]MCC4230580.1 DUF4129 domain-containing protein [Zunongwangia profunda]
MKILISLLLLINFNLALAQQDTIAQSGANTGMKRKAEETATVSPHDKIRYDRTNNLTPVEFKEHRIEEYKQDKDFNYLEEKQQKTWWQEFKEWINQKYQQFLHWLFGDYDAGSIFGFIIKLVPYILLIGVICLIIWLFTRMNPGKDILQQPQTAKVHLDDEEEIIQNADIPSLINTAIENGQYRMAVRYYYLQALKELDLKNFIEFEAQKTNNDYISEITNEQLNRLFRKGTRVYNFIWYGDFQVSKEDFLLAEKGFSELNSTIKNTKNE